MINLDHLKNCFMNHTYLIGAGVFCTAMFASPFTSAQGQTTETYREIDNIVVTAQKREESLQDVPLSVQAFDAQTLNDKQITGVEDIAEFAPSVYTYPAAANSDGIRVAMRGIGQIDPQIGLDSKVAVYIDGLYVSKIAGLAFSSPDLHRIEILKGPQGTLYGRNAVAGAINLISAPPDPTEFVGKANIGFGDYGQLTGSFSVNAPLSDRTALRVSAQYEHKDGWVDNHGEGEDFSGYERYGARIALGVDYSDNLRFDIAFDQSRSESQPHYYQDIPQATATSAFATAFPNPSFSRQEDANTLFPNEDGWLEHVGLTFTADYTINDDHSARLVAGYRETDGVRFVSLGPGANGMTQITHPQFGPINIPTLSAIVGNFNREAAFGGPNGTFAGLGSIAANLPEGVALRDDFGELLATSPTSFFASAPGGNPNFDGHEQFSAELTFNGNLSNGNFEYTSGIFYFDETTSNQRNLSSTSPSRVDSQHWLYMLGALTPLGTVDFLNNCVELGGAACGTGNLAAIGAIPVESIRQMQLDGAISSAQNDLVKFLRTARNPGSPPIIIDTEAFALYANLTWHISERMRLTGGLRYSDEEKSGIQQPVTPFFGDTTDLLGGTIPTNTASISYDAVDPSIILEYDLTDDVMVYASRSESYRSGGLNQVALSVELNDAMSDITQNYKANPDLPYSQEFIYQPEEITAYEIGTKGEYLDGRLRVNAAAFFYELDNEQVTTPLDNIVSTARAVVNTDTEVYGLEVDATYLLGEYFTIMGHYAYTDGDPGPRENLLDGEGGVRDDTKVTFEPRDRLQSTPEHAWLLSVDYRRPIKNEMIFFAQADYSHKDDVFGSTAANGSAAPEGVVFDSRDLFNIRTGLDLSLRDGNQATVAFWVKNLTDEEYIIDGIDFSTSAQSIRVFGPPRSMGVSFGLQF